MNDSLGDSLGHKSLVDSIVEYLERKIIDRDFRPGDRIIEQHICEQLDVSRTPVREAFRILENHGFIISRARKGAIVATATLKEALDIYTIRANLESLAVYLTVKRQPVGLIQKLKEIQNNMVIAAKENDHDEYYRLNKEFHQLFIRSSDNKRLIEMLKTFDKHTERYRKEVLLTPGRLEESLEKHSKLIKSVEQGNAEFAEKIRKNAILENLSLLEKRLNKEGESNED